MYYKHSLIFYLSNVLILMDTLTFWPGCISTMAVPVMVAIFELSDTVIQSLILFVIMNSYSFYVTLQLMDLIPD